MGGYFILDAKDTREGLEVVHRTVKGNGKLVIAKEMFALVDQFLPFNAQFFQKGFYCTCGLLQGHCSSLLNT